MIGRGDQAYIYLDRLCPSNLLTPASAAALGIPSPTPQQLGRPVFGPGRIDPRFDAVYQYKAAGCRELGRLICALQDRLRVNTVQISLTASLKDLTRDGV
jgi:hypothetical protein